MQRFECKTSEANKVFYLVGHATKPKNDDPATIEAIAPDAPMRFDFTSQKTFCYDSAMTLFTSRLKKDWDNTQDIQALMAELKDKGPLLVMGQFGQDNYKKDALLEMNQQIDDTVVHAFKKGSFVGGSNAMATVVGAGIDAKNGPYVLLTLRGKRAQASPPKYIMMTFDRFNEAVKNTQSLKFDPDRCAALKKNGATETEEVHDSNGFNAKSK